MEKSSKSSVLNYTATLGFLSITLYFLLYSFEEVILSWSKLGGWYVLVPVVITLIFYWVHGTFTSHFWDLLGVKAKSVKK
jgi:hypothetical protein